jgi:hypothetical protein
MANKVIQERFVKLKHAAELCSLNVKYTSAHACRKLLQVPFAVVGTGSIPEAT